MQTINSLARDEKKSDKKKRKRKTEKKEKEENERKEPTSKQKEKKPGNVAGSGYSRSYLVTGFSSPRPNRVKPIEDG